MKTPPRAGRGSDVELQAYDAGLLPDPQEGVAPTAWWQDVIRNQLEAAHAHYQSQVDVAEDERLLEEAPDLVGAIAALRTHQRQLDEFGEEVGVSRQALNLVLDNVPAPPPPAPVAWPDFRTDPLPRNLEDVPSHPVLWMLGLASAPWQLQSLATLMRQAGVARIPRRAEAEYAAALAYLVGLALEHGDDWSTHFDADKIAWVAEAQRTGAKP